MQTPIPSSSSATNMQQNLGHPIPVQPFSPWKMIICETSTLHSRTPGVLAQNALCSEGPYPPPGIKDFKKKHFRQPGLGSSHFILAATILIVPLGNLRGSV